MRISNAAEGYLADKAMSREHRRNGIDLQRAFETRIWLKVDVCNKVSLA